MQAKLNKKVQFSGVIAMFLLTIISAGAGIAACVNLKEFL
jgi:hypothetical protein